MVPMGTQPRVEKMHRIVAERNAARAALGPQAFTPGFGVGTLTEAIIREFRSPKRHADGADDASPPAGGDDAEAHSPERDAGLAALLHE
jgi:hypothetical protein